MNEESEVDIEKLIEQHLLFLRGRGPEPSLPIDRQDEVRGLFNVIDALADREPAPPFEEDPVAIRLGLVQRPDEGGQPSPPAPPDSRPESQDDPSRPSPVELSLRELVHRFANHVEVDLSPPGTGLSSPVHPLVGLCTSPGETVAVLLAPVDGWTTEPDDVAVVFRQQWRLTAVALTSADAQRAVMLTAADSNRAIDPARGWLAPGSPASPEPLGIALGRHFERVLPRWERVAGLDDLLDLGDPAAEASAVSTREAADALAAKPRLDHKKEALRSLRALDPQDVASIVVVVQTQGLTGDALLGRIADIARAATS